MSHKHGCKRALTGTIVGLSLMLIALATSVEAAIPENLRLIVQFEAGQALTWPQMRDGALAIQTSSGTEVISALSLVCDVRPLYAPGTPGFSLDGPWRVFLFSSGVAKADLIAAAQAHSLVAWCEEEPGPVPVTAEVAKAHFPTDPRFCNQQDEFHRARQAEPWPGAPAACQTVFGARDFDIDLPQAWGITQGDTSVVVAVIDTDFDWTHPELGGPPPGSLPTTTDSLAAYNGGSLWRNWREYPGDSDPAHGPPDGAPGVAFVDDDQTGKIDEDSMDFDRNNTAEPDVLLRVAEGVSPTTVTVSSINPLPPGFYNGARFYPPMAIAASWTSFRILTNSSTTVTLDETDPFLIALLTTPGFGDGIAELLGPGATFKLGDGLDNDSSGPSHWDDPVVDDIGWQNDLVYDDDENGFEDDLRGWDFVSTWVHVDPSILPHGDYELPDNDTRGPAQHGTMVANVVGATEDGLGMTGVAPGCRILPIRIGLVQSIQGSDPAPGLLGELVAPATAYAVAMGADIIVLAAGVAAMNCDSSTGCANEIGTSYTHYGPAALDALGAAVAAGVVVVNGASNTNCEIPAPPAGTEGCIGLGAAEGIISVAGVNEDDTIWRDANPAAEATTYGTWVDIAAQANRVRSSTTRQFGLPAPVVEDRNPVGTSVASPIVGGVVALLRSAYPSWDGATVRAKLLASVDEIYDLPQNQPYTGKLGPGRVNAYKALTFWGDIPAAGQDTTWTGHVYVSGDVHVPAGKTLTLEPGTVVHVAQDDIADRFDVPRQIEFRVAGTLVCNGAVGDSVVFRPFWECPGTPIWGPMTTEGAGSIVTQYTRFEGLTPDRVLYPNGGEALAAGAPAQLTWTADLIQTPCTPPVRMLDKVDLYFSSDGGQIWSVIALGVQNTGSYQWTAGPPLVTEEGRVKVVFKDSSGAWRGEDASDGDFWVIAPWLMGTFVDRSSETQLDYEGMPYSSIAFDYDQDGDPDLMVSQSDAVGRLFARTTLSGNQAPVFAPKTSDAFVAGSEPRNALRGLSFTSFDGDSYPDVFAARDTGAQLFRNKGVPQGGGEVTFEDLADSLGVSGWATKSYGGSWADYDGDGRPDLLIARAGSSGGIEPQGAGSPQPLILLRNNTNGPTGTFENVSASSLITPPGDSGIDARTVTWADFDADGDQDVFVGNRGNLGSRLYVNQGNGTFQQASGGPADVGKVTAATWGDLDGDQDLDLAVAVAPGNPATPHLVWFANQGSGVLGTQTALDTGYLGAEGVHILDANLDRRMDLVVLPGPSDTLQTPHLLLQGPPGFPAGSFADATVTFGLGASTGSVGGASVTDYDGDRRADLFLGRTVAGGQFYFRNEALPSQSPPPGVVVRLVGGGGGNDPMGTGALVTLLHNGLPVAAQPVDGGSSRGGQRARDLVFGADGGGVFEAETTWSEGFVQRDTLVVGQLNVVQDKTDPAINHTTMTASYQPEPGGTATLTFGWSGAWRGRDHLNAVTLSSTAGCLNEPVTYWASDPNVDLAVAKQGSVVTYTLTVYGVPCIPNCTYTWYCQTSTDFRTSTTAANPKTFKTKVCAQ